jgi:hypothetical protein
VVTDFWIYWWHRLQHESRSVWQFHKTHHSQVHLNVMTTFRATLLGPDRGHGRPGRAGDDDAGRRGHARSRSPPCCSFTSW